MRDNDKGMNGLGVGIMWGVVFGIALWVVAVAIVWSLLP